MKDNYLPHKGFLGELKVGCKDQMSKWYFVNVERGNIADKLQPRNINVSFTNNSNVPIDVIIFTFYSDQLTIDVETEERRMRRVLEVYSFQ